jgi:hypothetical protein
VQSLGLQMRIAAEHFPVFVVGDQRDLLNRKACFEEAAFAFMPKIVKAKVFDLGVTALAPEGCADRSSIVGEYPTAVSGSRPQAPIPRRPFGAGMSH